MRSPRSATQPTPDRGSITGFVTVLVVVFVACAGLALDGGRLVAVRVSAADHAENAARVAAQELTGLRSGARALDPPAARARAMQYLAEHGLVGTVEVRPGSVTVTVRARYRPSLLRLFGVQNRTVTATRSAEWVVAAATRGHR